jgi:hypothetical protein
MKASALSLLFSLLIVQFNAQSFSSPESVEYDGVNNRWIVGQNGANRVDIYSPQSNILTPFGTTITSGPHGIEVLDTVAYVCDGGRVRGYGLATGNQVFNLNLSASFLNGITSDGGHFLFVTDFTAKKIYRVDVLAGTFNQMATTVKTPNGIYYDGANNRCVFVTWGSSAAIQAISLADSTISTLYTTTQSNIDGITRDNAGYWYYTAWSNNSLMRIDPNFSSAPIAVLTGLSSPADIDINAAGDSIGIPNSGNASNVVFYTNITTGMFSVAGAQLHVFPNPTRDIINLFLDVEPQDATVEARDIAGRLIHTQKLTTNTLQINCAAWIPGTYFISVFEEGGARINQTRVCKH